MQELSVVLLNFNGKEFLKEFLPKVVEFSKPHNVVVVDNGSTDRSAELVSKKFPEVRLIQFDTNYGFCGGYNKAIELIDSEYTVLLNTDVEVTKDWIAPILKFLRSNPEYVAAQPKILDQRDKSKFEYAGAAGGFIDHLGYPFCRGRIFQHIEEDLGQYNTTKDVFWASGSCLFIKTESFVQLGGLDEEFFAHMEEIDLCWRVWNSGKKVAVVPESKVYHVGGGTLNTANPKKTYLNFRNGLSLLIKNESPSSLLWKIPLRIMLDWVAVLKFSIESGPKHGFAILRAHWYNTINIRSVLKRRIRINPTELPRYYRSIAWEYFVRRKKTFKSLRPH